jgi:transcriptional regulator with XRE-family HTH domain
MKKSEYSLLPRIKRLLTEFGSKLRHARLRRRYSAELVAQRADITRKTLYRVEQGDPAVALGIYARVLQVLRLESDVALLAADDKLGRTLQDVAMSTRKRAPKGLGRSAGVESAQHR